MAEKVNIATLNIDTNELIKKATETKKAIQDLSDQQKVLKITGKETSEEFVKNEAQLKKLKAEYNQQTKAVSGLIAEDGKLITTEKALTIALDSQSKSIEEARKQNTELLAIRNKLDLSTKAGQDNLALINSKIDDNNNFIKRNVSELEKQKIGIGDYASGVKGALSELLPLNQATAQYTQLLNSFSGVFDKLKTDFASQISLLRASAQSTDDMSKAQKAQTITTNVLTGATRAFGVALVATGIGAIIVLVGLLITYFKNFQPLLDWFEKTLGGVGAVVDIVVNNITQFVKGLSDVEGTLKKITSFIANPIKGFKDLGKSMGDAFDAGAKLVEQMQALDDAMKMQEIAGKRAEQQIAQLMLQAKNRTLTEQERITLLQKASKIDEDNFKREQAIAVEKKRIALQDIQNIAGITKQEMDLVRKSGIEALFILQERSKNSIKITDEQIDKLKEAELAIIESDKQSIQRQEKIQNQQDALREKAEQAREKAAQKAEADAQKAEAQRQKRVEDAIKESQNLIRLFQAETGFKAKELEQQIAFEEELSKKRLALLEQERKAGKKTKTEYEAEKLEITNDFLLKQAQLSVAMAKKQLDEEIEISQSKIDKNKFISEQLIIEEKLRLEALAQLRKDFEQLRFEEGLISFSQYQDALALIDEESYKKKLEVDALRKEQQAEANAIDLENKRAIEDQLFQDDLAIQLQRLELQRQQEVAMAEKKGADVALVNQKFDNMILAMKRKRAVAEVETVQNVVRETGALLSAFGVRNKNLMIAIATADAFLAATKAYLSQLNLDPTAPVRAALAGAKALAFGMANVIRIGATDQTFAKGGILQGASHANGGIKTPFGELEGNEAVINKNSTREFTPLLSAINVAGGGVAFDNAGENSKGMDKLNLIDYGKLAQAVSSLPAPIVLVDDINRGQNNVAEVYEFANF
jgi:hypothetical protein